MPWLQHYTWPGATGLSSWRGGWPPIVGDTEYSRLGIEQAVFLSAGYLYSGICAVCLFISRRPWADCQCLQILNRLQEWVPDSWCCTNKTAISGFVSLQSSALWGGLCFLRSIGPAIFPSDYTAVVKIQLHSGQARKTQVDRSFASVTDGKEFLLAGRV